METPIEDLVEKLIQDSSALDERVAGFLDGRSDIDDLVGRVASYESVQIEAVDDGESPVSDLDAVDLLGLAV